MNQFKFEHSAGVAFGPFEFYPLQRSLLRDGQPVGLGSRALAILAVLLERPGALISKDELIGRVWPDTHVEEVALRVHLTALRKILGDGRPEARDFINVPGRGYQFTTPVVPTSSSLPVSLTIDSQPESRKLPAKLSRIIGREHDIAVLSDRLKTDRCVTIVGAGGIGKTTVALALAHNVRKQYSEDVRFVDLAPLSSERHLIDAIVAAVGVASPADLSVARLTELLINRDMLLILDNCEHLVEYVANIVGPLSAAAKLTILATSREPLRLENEWTYRLPSLESPSDSNGLTGASALRYSAVELFVERAAASANGFVIDETNAPIVADICSQLDGHALAIELAASRMDKFGVADIAAMLEDRFRALRRSRASSLARHASLAGALDWSYDMLTASDQSFLHHVSAFTGRFSVQDAVAVSGAIGMSRGQIIEALADLVDRSFLTVDLSGHVAYYRLYETMREYARQKAQDHGRLEATRHAHGAYLIAVTERAHEESEALSPSDWMCSYARYIDDIRAALDWKFGFGGDISGAIRLTAYAVPVWIQLSFLNELQQSVTRAIGQLDASGLADSAEAMKLYAALSYAMVNLYGPTSEGTEACRKALVIAKQMGDHSHHARALLALWNGCFANGEVRQSLALAQEFMSIAIKLGHADVLVGHRMLGSSHFYLGDVASGRKHMEIMVAGYSATSHEGHMTRFGFGQLASGRGLLAQHLCYQGLYGRAMVATRQSAQEAIDSKHAMTICGVLATTSIANAISTGEIGEARAWVEVLKEQSGGLGLKRWENFGLGLDGIVLIREGFPDQGLVKLATAVSRAGDRANTRYMNIFAEHALALGKAGDPSGGMAAVDEVLQRLEGTGEQWFLPELFRVRGELLWAAGSDDVGIEAALTHSLALADELGALSFRLRTSCCLAEFLAARGRSGEAFTILSDTYARFAEGFDCPTLVKARKQIQELAPAET
ncbi:winged helix-turn-helix domain-containing protein [Rhizobium sp. WYJ-E13]|uniref:ATP-binding protein n=1 Tax=Rhizobium sp. WYJ-E13 TaxID=2849093 RepID=UPI001C1ED671|nr:winged helix-turn-helix domain-containing protein [Rhizobium sp. WYJ-E13]QWW72580.1 helix-turn-helix transcriptional regulator [Rhizobium sp. WYJ-E13]